MTVNVMTEKRMTNNKSISNQNHGVVYFLEGVKVKLEPASTFANLLVPGPDQLCHTRQDGM